MCSHLLPHVVVSFILAAWLVLKGVLYCACVHFTSFFTMVCVAVLVGLSFLAEALSTTFGFVADTLPLPFSANALPLLSRWLLPLVDALPSRLLWTPLWRVLLPLLLLDARFDLFWVDALSPWL